MAADAPAPALALTHLQRTILTAYRRGRTHPAWLVTRADFVLAIADGASVRATAARLGATRVTVRKWVRRWTAAAARFAAADRGDDRVAAIERLIRETLADAPRAGAPATFTAEQIARILAVACEVPDDGDRPVSHWTPRELAAEVVTREIVPRISVRSVGRFLDFGGGRTQAAPEPVLADAADRRSGAAGRRDRRGL